MVLPRPARIEAGSSPLTRGKLGPEVAKSRCRGLIPAHAGKTALVSRADDSFGAHPRSRGENSTEGVSISAVTGSSPLTRGKPRPASQHHTKTRLIPAHAGKTSGRDVSSGHGAAHPRSRGENIPQKFRPSRAQGSSPLPRGKPAGARQRIEAVRLIPAHAGKTPPQQHSPSRGRAHPRSRGENPLRNTICQSALGSSPLTRGKLLKRETELAATRLIPAHAGKT